MGTILVTGATGNVGSRIVRALAAREVPVRALVRRGEGATLPPRVERAEGDFTDAASVAAALRGIDRLYLLTTGPDLARHEATVIDAAARAGVSHVVKHSVAGAQYEASTIPRWHREGEKRLESARLGWTHLRPASFASNALGWAGSIRANGTVYGALGATALPVIDPEDIAQVAVRVLLDPAPHAGRAYELSGPEALTTAEQVAQLAGVLGRPLSYVNVPDGAARDAMLGAGMPPAWVDAMLELIGVLRGLGRVAPTDAVPTLLGRPATSFRAWAETNAAAFR